MTKILITGGAGFLGSYLAIEAIKRKYQTLIIDNYNFETVDVQSKKFNCKLINKQSEVQGIKFIEYDADITEYNNLKMIILKERPNIIIHAASLVMDRLSMHLPDAFIKTNVVGSQNLINICNELDCLEHLLFISSRSAIGEKINKNSTIKENDLFHPINPYGASKAAAEGFFHCYQFNSGTNVSIIRMQPMYGPRCRHDMLPWRIMNSILTQEEFQKFGDGNAVRDWLYIDDAVEAIFKVLENPNGFNTFNVGTGVATTTNEVIATCEQLAGSKANIKQVGDVLGDAYFAGIADCTKIFNSLNWKYKVDLADGLEATYNYMFSQYNKNTSQF